MYDIAMSWRWFWAMKALMIILSVACVVALFALVAGPGRPRKTAVPDDHLRIVFSLCLGQSLASKWGCYRRGCCGFEKSAQWRAWNWRAEESADEQPDIVVRDPPSSGVCKIKLIFSCEGSKRAKIRKKPKSLWNGMFEATVAIETLMVGHAWSHMWLQKQLLQAHHWCHNGFCSQVSKVPLTVTSNA